MASVRGTAAANLTKFFSLDVLSATDSGNENTSLSFLSQVSCCLQFHANSERKKEKNLKISF
jgi:hypothetical protein